MPDSTSSCLGEKERVTISNQFFVSLRKRGVLNACLLVKAAILYSTVFSEIQGSVISRTWKKPAHSGWDLDKFGLLDV